MHNWPACIWDCVYVATRLIHFTSLVSLKSNVKSYLILLKIICLKRLTKSANSHQYYKSEYYDRFTMYRYSKVFLEQLFSLYSILCVHEKCMIKQNRHCAIWRKKVNIWKVSQVLCHSCLPCACTTLQQITSLWRWNVSPAQRHLLCVHCGTFVLHMSVECNHFIPQNNHVILCNSDFWVSFGW